MTQPESSPAQLNSPPPPSAPRPIIVVMGVSGCGKSTVGRKLADALKLPFLEGDDFHPPENVARMAAGIPLTDADREGWLRTLADRMAEAAGPGEGLVLSCSALKRRYRDVLREGAAGVRFVYLHGSPEVLALRMAQRTKHYMPPSLLNSQLATLEPPAADEHALAFDLQLPTQVVVATVISALTPTASGNP
ncbi:MAG: gluconate kinase [Rhodoferax sp.]|nr:gluconate kinase [Rhodoferax sp.]